MQSPQRSYDAPILKHLNLVLASPGFCGSERMCRFLRFIVGRALEGRSAELKEYTIGVEVFDRDPSFDPRIDPIVRVEARRLRSKLARYYDEANAGELRIELPKGTYVPQFRAAAPAAEPDLPAKPEARVAVFPLSHPAADTEAEYLADGLTQQIIHRLTRIEGLSVLGWQSASRMRDRQDIHEAARELGACKVLTGSVRTGGDRLRVAAQLLNVDTREFLWSDVFDRARRDLFAVEEEIADSIVRALTSRFIPLSPGRPPATPEAWELYFRGRYQWNTRSIEGLRTSLECHKAALELDPDCALAWAGLADSCMMLASYGVEDVHVMMEAARRAAERALELSPGLGEAEACLAMILGLHEWRWDDAERRFERAMAFSPGYASTFHWYAVDFCALRGRFAEAEQGLHKALQLEPFSAIIREGRGYLALLRHRYEEALGEYRRLEEFDPSFDKARASKARALIQLGSPEEAIRELETLLKRSGTTPPSVISALGQAHALAGNHPVAREHLSHLARLAEDHFVPHSCYAVVHIGLAEYAEAVDRLRQGAERHEVSVCAIGVHPVYDPLRTLPEFTALVERIGCLA